MTEHPHVRWELDRDVGIGSLTIDRAEAGNTITRGVSDAVTAAINHANEDDDVRVIVLRSSGPDLTLGWELGEAWETYVDAPGGNLKKMPSQRARLHAVDRYLWGPTGLYATILHSRKITVLEARGRCFDAGLHMALVCDVVVAASDAVFAAPRWRTLGVDGDISLLIASVGLKRASELMFLNGGWSAQRAAEVGLVDRVVDAATHSDAVAELAAACASIMRDGVATEKYLVFAALEKMGVGFGFATATLIGGLLSNIHHQPGEFNVLREVREHGRDRTMQQILARLDLDREPEAGA